MIIENQFDVERVIIKVEQYNQSGTRQKHSHLLQRQTGIYDMTLAASWKPY